MPTVTIGGRRVLPAGLHSISLDNCDRANPSCKRSCEVLIFKYPLVDLRKEVVEPGETDVLTYHICQMSPVKHQCYKREWGGDNNRPEPEEFLSLTLLSMMLIKSRKMWTLFHGVCRDSSWLRRTWLRRVDWLIDAFPEAISGSLWLKPFSTVGQLFLNKTGQKKSKSSLYSEMSQRSQDNPFLWSHIKR